MLAVLHAFSRKNAGDGLLVDLTLRLITDAGFDPAHCRILALDAASFDDLPNVMLVPGEPRARPSLALAGAALEVARSARRELFSLGPGGRVARLLDGCTGVVAVGGGYLVADSVVRQGGVLLNHLPQILAAGRAGVPSVYLPQSIGPLEGPVGLLTRRALSRVDVLYARDDETLRELRDITDVRRCPDLAVLRLADSLASIPRPRGGQAGPTVVIARDLPSAHGYVDRLRALGASVSSPLWAVQADIDGPRSDRVFLRTVGAPDAGDVKDVLAHHTPGVVVSVRLHGAIASLLAGWPAIHLSYERKGWGAYQDLGLAEYVHDARTFDVEKVRAQAAALHADPSPMFARIEERLPALLDAKRALTSELARRFERSAPR